MVQPGRLSATYSISSVLIVFKILLTTGIRGLRSSMSLVGATRTTKTDRISLDLLMLHVLVIGHEDIEVDFGEFKKLSILLPCPASFWNSLNQIRIDLEL
jgi:hypothetical protein